MEKRKLNRITAGFIVLVVMVLILMFSNSLRRSSHITLPEEGSSPGQTVDTNASGGDALTVIAVTPETVQTAIETLTRPRQYSRVIRVEQLWDGGSGSFETTVTVSGRWTRTDRSLSDGQVRHTITDGEITYIWYGSESSVYSAPAGDITPDDEQAIPTYESILDLPVEDIALWHRPRQKRGHGGQCYKGNRGREKRREKNAAEEKTLPYLKMEFLCFTYYNCICATDHHLPFCHFRGEALIAGPLGCVHRHV